MVGRTPVTRWLGRLVKARYLRIIPVEFRHTFYLRAEILGCSGGEEFNPNAKTTRSHNSFYLLYHLWVLGRSAYFKLVNMKQPFLLLLQMSWWPPLVWPHLPLVVGKWPCSAVSQASLHASTVMSASLLLCFVMVDRTARTTQMRSTVVRAEPCLLMYNMFHLL